MATGVCSSTGSGNPAVATASSTRSSLGRFCCSSCWPVRATTRSTDGRRGTGPRAPQGAPGCEEPDQARRQKAEAVDLNNRVVLITGAKRIGAVVAATVASRGADVTIAYNRSAAEADQAVEQ